jgi:hypothetical protein
MKFSQYVELINKLANNEELLDLEVVYSVDDEGNGYDSVKFGPEAIAVDGSGMAMNPEYSEANCICIN